MPKLNKDEAIQWYAQNRGLYKKLTLKINSILIELLEESGLTIHAITHRTKEVDSFKSKIDNPKYDDPINQITDLAGIRIIAYVEDDLKPICTILEEAFDIDPSNSGDKANELGTDKVGYKSIHYVAKIKSDRLHLPEYKKFKEKKFEIQVRTILQHAWAEIEHDRNYKFTGVLPAEIKRRFKVLAGMLEIADREFNQISQEIDKISASVTEAEKNNELFEIDVSTTTLKQYLSDKFKPLIEQGTLISDFNNFDNLIIKELNEFGIKNLSDLDSIIPKDFLKVLSENRFEYGNFLGLLRDIMMISDYKKYFTNSWKSSWKGFSKTMLPIYEKYKFNYQKAAKEYNLLIPTPDSK